MADRPSALLDTANMSEFVDEQHKKQTRALEFTEAMSKRHERIGATQLRRTRAFGKLILFGEHFVVYKVPALVAAVAAYTDCDCEFTDEPGLTGETRRMQTHAPETM